MISFICQSCKRVSGRADDYEGDSINCDHCGEAAIIEGKSPILKPMTLDEKYQRICDICRALDSSGPNGKNLAEYLDNELAYWEQRLAIVAHGLKQIGVKT